MADWLSVLLCFFLILGAMFVRRDRVGGTFIVLVFCLGMVCWAAFAFSGGRLSSWIGKELNYWEEATGPLVVGAALVLIAMTVVHALIWLARLLSVGPRRPDTSAVTPGFYTASGNDSGWEVFSGDGGGGDFGGDG